MSNDIKTTIADRIARKYAATIAYKYGITDIENTPTEEILNLLKVEREKHFDYDPQAGYIQRKY